MHFFNSSGMRLMVVMAGVGLTACVPAGLRPGNTMSPIVDTKPAVTIPLGAQQADVVALLGPPTRGPRTDAYSELVELEYVYPFPAVSAELSLGRDKVRTETADRVFLFFDRDGVLKQMGTRTDHYYHSFLTAPAQRITIAARALDVDGRQIPLVPGIVVPSNTAPPETPTPGQS